MSIEDLDVFFEDDWAEDAVLDGEYVRVIYGAPGETLLGNPGMATAMPRVLVRQSSLPPESAAVEDTVLEFPCSTPQRPIQRWRVRQVVPDGTGLATLILAAHESQA